MFISSLAGREKLVCTRPQVMVPCTKTHLPSGSGSGPSGGSRDSTCIPSSLFHVVDPRGTSEPNSDPMLKAGMGASVLFHRKKPRTVTSPDGGSEAAHRAITSGTESTAPAVCSWFSFPITVSGLPRLCRANAAAAAMARQKATAAPARRRVLRYPRFLITRLSHFTLGPFASSLSTRP